MRGSRRVAPGSRTWPRGGGWSTIAMARAYPGIEVDGLDLDAEAIGRARGQGAHEGRRGPGPVPRRRRRRPVLDGTFDLVTIFEAVHDMSRPVEVLRAVPRAAGAGRHGHRRWTRRSRSAFTRPGDDIERLMYGYSVFVCLPNGLAEQPSAGTGTVMRPATLRAVRRDGRLRVGDDPPDRARGVPRSTGWIRSRRRRCAEAASLASCSSARLPWFGSRSRPCSRPVGALLVVLGLVTLLRAPAWDRARAPMRPANRSLRPRRPRQRRRPVRRPQGRRAPRRPAARRRSPPRWSSLERATSPCATG